MASAEWEPASVKALLRLTSLRLGQLQEKKDSQGVITRRDIATLLQQRNVGLARAKAQRLLQDDALGDLLEVLEMHIGQLLEHFNELDQSGAPTPIVVEAASTLIFCAPHVDSKDLGTVSNLLTQRLGPDFARSAARNHDNYVSPTVFRTITAPPPSIETLDAGLEKIANDYGVKWSPEPRGEEILNMISEILDPQASPVVDIVKLRGLCCRGIPDEPSWLRPRVWKLLLGVLPSLKESWKMEMRKQRESYYDLVGRLLDPFSTLPPSQPPTSLDAKLLDVSKLLSSIPFSLFGDLVNEPEEPESFERSPLDDNALDEIRIGFARNLDVRLHNLQSRDTTEPSTALAPDIRLELQANGAPEISLSSPDARLPMVENGHATLLSFKPRTMSHTHQKHSSALLRLLYVHASINPGNLSPHVPSLLVVLYAVLNQEVAPEDLAHAEADTFWLFEAIVGEFSELEDEGGNIWMKRLSNRLAWADADLFKNLQVKGLDPALPHYSYRWLAPLLTHTLPLPSVLLVWDALFACPMRARDVNPKMDFLLDICTAMLIRTRAALFRLGKGGRKSPSLWAEDTIALPPPSPLRAWELGDAFLEGMSLMQLYPLEAAGGIGRILETASDLSCRRDDEAKNARRDKLSLGARLKVTMWKGFTNQESSPSTSPEESEEELSDEASHEDGNDTETPDRSEPLTSRLAKTVWRGITNQTSMEPRPPPRLPPSPSASPSPSPAAQGPPESPRDDGSISPKSSLWAYADKLKDSDTVATFAKVSSNWRAKAMLGSWGRSDNPPHEKEPPPPSIPSRSESVSEGYNIKPNERRRGSLPPINRPGVYSPPPRPRYFRPPRDSLLFPADATPSILNPDQNTQIDSSFMDKTRSLSSSLAALTRNSPSQPLAKSGPRPLLLSPSTPITSPPVQPISRSAGSTPGPDRGEWTHVMKIKGHSLHGGSQSSISSLSPSDALWSARSSRTDWDSDTGTSGRRVPLNRKSVSPMAPGSRVHQGRRISGSSSATSSDRGLLSPPLSTRSDLQDWSRVDVPRSPPSTSPTPTSPSVGHHTDGNMHFLETGDDMYELPQARKLLRKKTPPPSQNQTDDTSDSSVVQVPRSPRLRSKRYTSRPPNLNIQENTPRRKTLPERKLSNSKSLAVEWPADDLEMARTPRASSFTVDDDLAISPTSSRSLRRSRKVSTETQERRRKTSTDGSDTRPRKISSGQRTRKISNEHKETAKRIRENSAEEGDDEGYDDLLSAYESEEGSHVSSLRRST